MADRISPTPRNKLTGLLADFLGGAYDYAQRPDPTMPMGKANAVLSLLSDALPLKSAATVLDDLSYGQAPTRGTGMTTRLTPEATELALNALPFPRTAGKAALMGAGGVPGMEAAMFIGPTAKTWDKAAAATAQKLEKAGTDPRAIWSETGTIKGPDGKWRQELDDSKALFNPSTVGGRKVENDLTTGVPGFDFGPAVGSVIEHQLLKGAYPDGLTKSTLIGNKNTMFGDGVQGFYDETAGRLQINAPAKAADARSTMLHELQHAIQQREGFAPGGSPGVGERAPFVYGGKADQRMKEIERLFDSVEYDSPAYNQLVGEYRSLQPKSEAEAAFEGYRRLAGEAEARATQARMNMTPDERRATFPYDSYDVPVNQLIVRSLLD